jgi:DsbC/DsbD-like thiol-disulfide interchange protein
MERRVLYLVVALAVAGSSAVPLLAQAKKSDSVVKITAKGSKPDADGKQTVTVTIQIDKGWHIYANPVDNDMLRPAQTVVTLAGKEKLQDVKIEYPAGKVNKDEFVGDHKIYEDKVEIKAHVQRARNDSGPLEASVRIQSCDSSKCLLLATVKVSVE